MKGLLTNSERNSIAKIFSYYKLLCHHYYDTNYDEIIDRVHFDDNWIKIQGYIPENCNGSITYRYSLPKHLRNELNMPRAYIERENWKELIEILVKREYNENLLNIFNE
jgi:hypothetical protein